MLLSITRLLLDVGPSPGEMPLFLTLAAAFGLIGLFSLGIWLFALVDAIRTPDGAYRTGSRLLWILGIVLLGILGAAAYLLAGRRRA